MDDYSSNEKVYDTIITPLLDEILELCQKHSIPMIAAFCLEQIKLEGGKYDVLIAGAHHLDKELDPPPPMIHAALTLEIPGFGEEE